MKILMTTTTFPRYQGDIIPQFVFGLARSLVEAGAKVTVIAPHDHKTQGHEIVDDVEIRRFHYWLPKRAQQLCYGAGIPTNIRRKKWVAMQLPTLELGFMQAILRYGADADVLNPHWTFAAVPTVLAGKLRRKAIVPHAYSAEYVPKILHPINRFVVKQSQAVISISRYTADMVESVVQPKAHHVIGLGVNQEKIAPPDFDVKTFRAKHQIADDELVLFSFGRLVERKGYSILIEAVAELIYEGQPIRLLLAGKGPLHDDLQAQIDNLDIAQQATLLGFVPDSELCHYLKGADMLIAPAIVDHTGDTEGLGMTPLEAMANGTPVIASGIGGLLDVVQDRENGLLVEAGNVEELKQAILELSQDDSLRQTLIDKGYALINNTFSWQSIAQRTLAIYDEACRKTQA